jgi:hypothetical protein
MTDGTRAAFGGFIGAVIGGFLMDGMGVAVGVAVGVSLGVLLGADREWGPGELPVALTRTRHMASLRHVEDTIQERLSDMPVVRSVSSKSATRSRPNRRTSGRIAWQDAFGFGLRERDPGRQRERYHAKLWEIALVRWQNGLEPLASDWENSRTTNATTASAARSGAGPREAFLKEWAGVDLSEIPEGQRCVDRLKQALGSCAKLREP